MARYQVQVPPQVVLPAPDADLLLDRVCWAGHSFLRPDRLRSAFRRAPAAVSIGGYTYRRLADEEDRTTVHFVRKVQEAMLIPGKKVLVLVLGDNDFASLAEGFEIVRGRSYESYLSDPAAVADQWICQAVKLALDVGASHVVLSQLFYNFGMF